MKVEDRIQAMADAARPSTRGGSHILDLRIYVRDDSDSMGGKVWALGDDGQLLRDANGEEVALPLSDHNHVGAVVQNIADRVRAARAARSGQ